LAEGVEKESLGRGFFPSHTNREAVRHARSGWVLDSPVPGDPLLLHGVVEAGLTLFGDLMEQAPALIRVLARARIQIDGGPGLELVEVLDVCDGLRRLWPLGGQRAEGCLPPLPAGPLPGWWTPSESVRLARVELVTPLSVNQKTRESDAEKWLQREFLHHCLVAALQRRRAVAVEGEEIPKIDLRGDPDWPPVRVVWSKVRLGRMPRNDKEQGIRGDYFGWVGVLEMVSAWPPLGPLLRTAEVLHIGGRVTAGCGQIRVELLGQEVCDGTGNGDFS
jgi:hypothetical protein